MRIETLNERIENAESKIEKKTLTIEKKTKWIASGKKDQYEIEWLQEDIKRLNKEIEETKKSLENYKAQLEGEIAKEEILLKDIPESMKRMQTELVERWDAYDIVTRDILKEEYNTLGWDEFHKKHPARSDYEFRYVTDEQIHKSNIRDAKCLILDLYYRVKAIIGEITDWSNIRADQGSQGMTVLTGYVIGKEGRCYIESILAGGYNIQRLHVRVLTHAR